MAEVWGTVAVNDHLRLDAFQREVLLFNRLVVPVPKDDKERERWEAPNDEDPHETWDPDHLDEVLKILGSQRRPYRDAPLVWEMSWSHRQWNRLLRLLRVEQERWVEDGDPVSWEADWSEDRWLSERTRKEVADVVAADTFSGTRSILAMGEELPGVVEAVVAYPSPSEFFDETEVSSDPPDDLTAAEALFVITYPVLVPDTSGDPLSALAAAAALAREPEFQRARDEFYVWMRDYFKKLREPDAPLAEGRLDADSVKLAQRKLRSMYMQQEKLLQGKRSRSRWTNVQHAAVVAGTGMGAAGALVAAPALAGDLGLSVEGAALLGGSVGAVGQVAQLGGYIAGRNTEPQSERPLDGASMFITASGVLGRT